MKSDITPEALAHGFSAVLRKWLSADQMERVVSLNAREKEPAICHSHDFIDSNMAMLKAYTDLGGVLDLQDEAQRALWSEAWSIAKLLRFNVPLPVPGPIEPVPQLCPAVCRHGLNLDCATCWQPYAGGAS
jgi:hypothetical protein